jgi:hypothetical protein
LWVFWAVASPAWAPAASAESPDDPSNQLPALTPYWQPEPAPAPDQTAPRPFRDPNLELKWLGEPAPRLRFGIDFLLGGNSIYTPGSNQEGAGGTNGTGGIGLHLRGGVQLNELLSVELDFGGLLGPLLETRGAVLVGFTPLDWLSLGVGPAVGYQSGTECPLLCAPPVCPSYAGTYVASVERIDFLPGVGAPPGVPRIRRSFDIGLVGMVGAATAGAPQGKSPVGVGLYLVLGYLQF